MDDERTSTVNLTVAEAARRTNVSTRTIRRWLSSGRLPARFDGAQELELLRAEHELNLHRMDPPSAEPEPRRPWWRRLLG